MAEGADLKVGDTLRTFWKGSAVERANLARALGTDLCAIWDIRTGEDAATARPKLIWQIRQVITGLGSEEHRKTALFVFNITEYRDVRSLNLRERLEWGAERELCLKYENARKDVFDKIASTFQLTINAYRHSPPRPTKRDLEAIRAEYVSPIDWVDRAEPAIAGASSKANEPQRSPVTPSDQPSPPPKFPRPWLVPLAIAASVVLVGSVVLFAINASGGNAPSTAASRAPSSGQLNGAGYPTSFAPAIQTPSIPGIGTGPTATPIAWPPTDELGDGKDLQVTLAQIGDASGTWDVAFPRDSIPTIGQFLSLSATPENLDGYVGTEFLAGGYPLGGVTVWFDILNKNANEQVVLHNIKTINRKQEPPALGAAVIIGPKGGNRTGLMDYMLDSTTAVAREDTDDGTLGPEYFTPGNPVYISHTDKQSLAVKFVAQRNAYSFDVALDYEVGGVNHTDVLKWRGQDFRATPDPCLRNGVPRGLSAADIQVWNAKRFDIVHTAAGNADPSQYVASQSSIWGCKGGDGN